MPVDRGVATRWLPGLVLLLLAVSTTAQQRIASLNLCTDLMLLELVPSARIASVTYWAADPDMSYLSAHAAGLHLNKSLVEQIIPRQPDLVLAGQFSDKRVIDLLQDFGYRVAVLDVPLTLAGMRDYILEVGDLVGEPGRARALADELDQRLARVELQARAANAGVAPAPVAVVYGPQGVSPGRGTLMDDLLNVAGFRNLAAEVGLASYGTLSLERLVMAQPDLLVLDDLANNSDSIAHRALRHPVLPTLFPPDQVLSLPPSLTACVGPPAVDVAERLLQRRLQLAGEVIQ